VDEYFIENRTRVLEIAAFLDRLDRAGEQGEELAFRMRAFGEALRSCPMRPRIEWSRSR
jgi:hypothetical protein